MKTARKNFQIKKKDARAWNVKLGVTVLGLIITVVFLGQIYQTFGDFFKPLVSIYSPRQIWIGQSNINIVIRNGTVGVLTYNPNEAKITTLEIPDQTYIEVPGGFGKWKLASVYDLGQTESPPKGSQLLADAVVAVLGVPIDGFIQTAGQVGNGGAEGVMEKIRQNPADLFFMVRTLRTNLTFKEIFKLMWKLPKVRFDKVEKLSLNDFEVMEKSQLADGSMIYLPDQIRLDATLKHFIESKIADEGFTIAVFNATDKPGLGQKAARLITNLGGDVIILSNAEVKRAKSAVLVNPNIEESREVRRSLTFKKLKSLFVYNNEVETDLNDPQLKLSRALINVVIGEDF